MSRETELKRENLELIKQSRAMLATAGEDGNLSMGERVRFDKLSMQLKENGLTLEELKAEAPDVWFHTSQGRKAGGQLASDYGIGDGPGSYAITDSGDRVPILAPSDSLAKLVGAKPRNVRPNLVGRFVRGMVTNNWDGAESEIRGSMGIGSDTAGGYTIAPEIAAEIIDLARAKAAVIRAGARTVPMTSSELLLARVLSDPTATWKAENAAGDDSSMTFGQLRLRAKTLMVLCKMSVEMIEDAVNASATIENAIASSMALGLDSAALYGIGAAEEPGGIYNGDDVQSVEGGDELHYDNLSAAIQKVAEQNGTATAAIFAPRTAGVLDRFKDGEGRSYPGTPAWIALQKYATNQVRTTMGTGGNESQVFLGDFSTVMIGTRTDLVLEVSRQAGDSTGSAFKNLQVWIRAYLRADVGLARGAHLCIVDGITST